MTSKDEKLLEVEGLRTEFNIDGAYFPVVDGVKLTISRGETVGLVGESGSGKSVTSLSIMRLISKKAGRIASGKITFEGKNLLSISDKEVRHIRGNEIAMIFQEPMSSLNPVYTVGDQISEAIILHQKVSSRQAMGRAVEMLKMVGISDAEMRAKQYPHQMSGGIRQRVMIAMALSCNPKLLIADEPTTALDVTIQAQILELMKDLKEKVDSSILLITHDLGVIADMADRVLVMYAGKIVEDTDVYTLFEEPLHPYTEGLLTSIPQFKGEKSNLHVINGQVPSPFELPKGCRFHPRCTYAKDICRHKEPELKNVNETHSVACWIHSENE